MFSSKGSYSAWTILLACIGFNCACLGICATCKEVREAVLIRQMAGCHTKYTVWFLIYCCLISQVNYHILTYLPEQKEREFPTSNIRVVLERTGRLQKRERILSIVLLVSSKVLILTYRLCFANAVRPGLLCPMI